jgi:hypothetical protein
MGHWRIPIAVLGFFLQNENRVGTVFQEIGRTAPFIFREGGSQILFLAPRSQIFPQSGHRKISAALRCPSAWR